jgi:capsular exopolysaccharide synthesis family protein
LAASLARSGRKTLIIDCDFRNPSLQRVLDIPQGVGLCEFLRGEIGLSEAIQATEAPGLDFLPAGELNSAARKALAQDRLRRLFDELKRNYDFIIVDSAPVLLVSDTLLISQNVDGVLFSVLRHVSRLPQVHAAHERLLSLGTTMLGAVVSGVQTDVYESYEYANS